MIGDDGKIKEVGEGAPEITTANTIDVAGKLVTPGCVEAHCHVGVDNAAVRWEGADYNEKSDPITPHMRPIYAFSFLTSCGNYGILKATK